MSTAAPRPAPLSSGNTGGLTLAFHACAPRPGLRPAPPLEGRAIAYGICVPSYPHPCPLPTRGRETPAPLSPLNRRDLRHTASGQSPPPPCGEGLGVEVFPYAIAL